MYGYCGEFVRVYISRVDKKMHKKKLYFIKNINFVASIRNINRYGTYLAECNNILTHIYI